MENKEKDFFAELLNRILSFLDPKKTAVILVFAVFAGLLGFAVGEIFFPKEYRTYMTVAIQSRDVANKTQNLSTSHHIADVFEALYDNDEVIEKTLKEMKSERTTKQFVKNLNVAREEMTVLVKINYTDLTKEKALNGINIYQKNICNSLTKNLGYNGFTVLSPASEPVEINHTRTVVLVAIFLELVIALVIIIVRIFPGVIIITGNDLKEFNQPILGEVFITPNIDINVETQEEE